MPEELDLGIRPETKLREIGETEFIRRHQCPVRSLAAFEKSEHPDDWRDLMRRFLVRRTRGFVRDNYAVTDDANGRKYLTFADGRRSYFPLRVPRTVKFTINDSDASDAYARLYSAPVVDAILGRTCLAMGWAITSRRSPIHPRHPLRPSSSMASPVRASG